MEEYDDFYLPDATILLDTVKKHTNGKDIDLHEDYEDFLRGLDF